MLRALEPMEPKVTWACYVNPPMGAFEEHESGCGPAGIRQSVWNEPWSRAGNRLEDNKSRWLVKFRRARSEPLTWLCDVRMVTEPPAELRSRSQRVVAP